MKAGQSISKTCISQCLSQKRAEEESHDIRSILFRFSKLGLVLPNGLDLLCAGAGFVESVVQPVGSQLLSQLDTDDSLAHAENLGVVAENGSLDAEGVVGSDGSDASHLVGSNSNSEASAANHKGTVGFTLLDQRGSLDGDVRVCSLVGGRWDTDVYYARNERVLLEMGFKSFLVGVAGIIAAHGDAERWERGSHLFRMIGCFCVRYSEEGISLLDL